MLLVIREETSERLEQLARLIGSSGDSHQPIETRGILMPETVILEQPIVEQVEQAQSSTVFKEGIQIVDSAQTFAIPTTLVPCCSPKCRCKCHRKSTRTTPKFLTSITGRMLISTTGAPVHSRSPCSHSNCSGSAKSIRLCFIFPRWMIRRMVFAHLAWNSALNTGASLHLKVRRTIPWPHEVWGAIERHDLDNVRALISEKRVLPTDIDNIGFGQGLVQAGGQ